MIFCHTNAFFVGVVKSSLDEFVRVFSLVANLEKIYFPIKVSEQVQV